MHSKVITQENGRKNIFRLSQTTNKVNVTFLSVYKKRNKVCLVYLECKLQEDRYG